VSYAKKYTPNSIANEIMAEDAWHDSLWVRDDDYEALRTELAEARRDAERLRDIFRANMLRYVPGVTHEGISAALDGGRWFVNPKPSAAIDAARKETP